MVALRDWLPGGTRRDITAGNGHPSPGLPGEAGQFITRYHAEHPAAGQPATRLAEVQDEIHLTGTYTHTPGELRYAARVAWRNSARCIGRLGWRSLQIRDRRHVTTGAEMAAETISHLAEATNGGSIHSTITIFAPDAPGRPGPRILSSQVVRYAGWQDATGTVTGDPVNSGLTRLAAGLGWPGPASPGRFDILPLLVQGSGERPSWHELPPAAVLEIPLTHPDFSWFASLGLRWHAVPVISDMYLLAGGIRYPAAPFNGWYMVTEIGSRDLGDTGRYDQLPVIAARMGLDTRSKDNLWKDKAMTELNVAVLHSFRRARVTITDHHSEATRFARHVEAEARYGRACPADQAWIYPPTCASATAVWDLAYENFDETPNYYRHDPAF